MISLNWALLRHIQAGVLKIWLGAAAEMSDWRSGVGARQMELRQFSLAAGKECESKVRGDDCTECNRFQRNSKPGRGAERPCGKQGNKVVHRPGCNSDDLQSIPKRNGWETALQKPLLQVDAVLSRTCPCATLSNSLSVPRLFGGEGACLHHTPEPLLGSSTQPACFQAMTQSGEVEPSQTGTFPADGLNSSASVPCEQSTDRQCI